MGNENWYVEGLSSNDGEALVIADKERTICWIADSIDADGKRRVTDKAIENAVSIAKVPRMLEALKLISEWNPCAAPHEADGLSIIDVIDMANDALPNYHDIANVYRIIDGEDD